MSDDVWLETDASVEDAAPAPAAKVLESVAQTLSEAPEGCRYDIELRVTEVKSE